MKAYLCIGSILLAAFFLGGCIFAPTLDSISKAGFTKGDREGILSDSMKKFHDALYWGNPSQALAMVTDEGRENVLASIKKSKREERIVDSKVEMVDFKNDSFEAEVDVTVRYFQVPYYVVKDRTEREQWEFSLVDGWRLRTRDVVSVQ